MFVALLLAAALLGKPWTRYTIDDSSRGADGVRLIDINTDGRPDIATAWEEGGLIRVYFNPSRVDARRPWPAVTVGKVASPEDAVFADLDRDLAFDVVSSAEGNTRSLQVHWAPKDPDRFFDPSAWTTTAIPAAANLMQWMFAAPWSNHVVAAGKGPGAALGWFEIPANARDTAAWRWHPLRPVGWIMSVLPIDMDADGDSDILFSDRRGPRSGVFFLANPGDVTKPWPEIAVGSAGREVMFLDVADVDGDGLRDVAAAVKPNDIEIHYRLDKAGTRWRTEAVSFPGDLTGTAKAVRVADVDLDGHPDLLYSAEAATGPRSGVIWYSLRHKTFHDIAGPEGVKYDLMELLDLDADGDLDVVTTEETAGLGLVWYENPSAR
ncbi:MAG: VCBS repeat-containing protein [Bryobacterales bacterium]|nr:VCBS repeat-containing protein [Bryobacterales bacterium]